MNKGPCDIENDYLMSNTPTTDAVVMHGDNFYKSKLRDTVHHHPTINTVNNDSIDGDFQNMKSKKMYYSSEDEALSPMDQEDQMMKIDPFASSTSLDTIPTMMSMSFSSDNLPLMATSHEGNFVPYVSIDEKVVVTSELDQQEHSLHVVPDEKMRDPTYWKNVQQFEEGLFAQYGARHVPLSVSNEDLIKSIIRENEMMEEPFYILDLSRLVRQFLQWRQHFPRIAPFYAVKCNDSPILIQVLDYLGASFDCASKGEIDLVLKNANYLAPDRAPMDPATRIIYANPCKMVSHLRHAASTGVEMTTFDNEHELYKIKQHWPDAKVVLRIKTDDSQSVCQFSTKFGASVESGEAEKLVGLCRDLDLNLYGVSFHVGSGCQAAHSFVDAVKNARRLFDIALDYGFSMKLLDIGGGFPGSDGTAAVDFVEIAEATRPVIDELFDESIQVIAEPGRYFAQAPYTLCCSIFAKRDKKTAVPIGGNNSQQTLDGSSAALHLKAASARGKHVMHTIPVAQAAVAAQPEVLYYINDGVYGSFNCIFFDHVQVDVQHIPASAIMDDGAAPKNKGETRLSTVYGPTCDSIDKIIDTKPLPEMDIGDYVFFPLMGSYTMAASSAFNGFKTKTFFYVWKN